MHVADQVGPGTHGAVNAANSIRAAAATRAARSASGARINAIGKHRLAVAPIVKNTRSSSSRSVRSERILSERGAHAGRQVGCDVADRAGPQLVDQRLHRREVPVHRTDAHVRRVRLLLRRRPLSRMPSEKSDRLREQTVAHGDRALLSRCDTSRRRRRSHEGEGPLADAIVGDVFPSR